MPELPEVETTRRGIAPHLKGRTLAQVLVRCRDLRQPVPDDLETRFRDSRLLGLYRRAKYLLLETSAGWLILHLGMTGSLRMVAAGAAPLKHDHVDLVLDNGLAVRYRDPRRFGVLLWQGEKPEAHPLLAKLGPEPLSADFNGGRLWRLSRGRRMPVKSLIMDNGVVVGVGNVYACETLFRAGIHPARPAGSVSRCLYGRLADAIREVLEDAIAAGATTLGEFTMREKLMPGYFRRTLQVYGREGEPCPLCGRKLETARIGQRTTWFCRGCQR